MRFINYILIIFLLTGCGFGGTHGKIQSFYFDFLNNDDLVRLVDFFLQNNSDYHSTVDSGSGWVFIQIPLNGNQFKFRIGGVSEIVLIAAGENNKKTKLDKDLGYFEKNRLINSFETDFINKLNKLKSNNLNILKNPFALTINKNIDTTWWPMYVIKHDTLVEYSLPKEIDTLGIDYFKDLIVAYSGYSSKEIFINQYYDLFRITNENYNYTGYIRKGFFVVNAYYRVVGQNKKYNPIFNQNGWKKYLDSIEVNKRKKAYENNRKINREKGYKETNVYNDRSEEYWMINYNFDSYKKD